MKGDRKIAMGIPTSWFEGLGKAILKDKTCGETFTDRRTEDEWTEKAFLLYSQSWVSREVYDKSIGGAKA